MILRLVRYVLSIDRYMSAFINIGISNHSERIRQKSVAFRPHTISEIIMLASITGPTR